MPDNAIDAYDRLASTVFEAVLDGHPAMTSIEEVFGKSPTTPRASVTATP